MKGEMNTALKALRTARQRIIATNEGRAKPLSRVAQNDAADLVMEAQALVHMFISELEMDLEAVVKVRRAVVLEELQISSAECALDDDAEECA